jgi:predicted nucleic acid-binding protein
VILRVVLRRRDALREWRQITRGVASALVEVECLRTLDRLRLVHRVSDRDIALRREGVLRVLRSTEVVDLGRSILRRAAQPMPTTLGTLDAIHLSTALIWQEHAGEELHMATHDHALATAARAQGLSVLGA